MRNEHISTNTRCLPISRRGRCLFPVQMQLPRKLRTNATEQNDYLSTAYHVAILTYVLNIIMCKYIIFTRYW